MLELPILWSTDMKDVFTPSSLFVLVGCCLLLVDLTGVGFGDDDER